MLWRDTQYRHYVICMAIAFTMPVYQKLIPMLFAFLVANWILQGKKAFHFSSLKSNLPLISLIIFFVWHLLGMIWSSNQSFGWFDIQIKLPFLLLPLVFSNMQRLKVNQFQNVLMAFLWGCIVAILIGFGNAIYAYASGITPFLDFYDINISPLLHISYFAMYLNLALVISLYLIITRERDFYSLGNALLIILAFAFALMVYLTTSRNGFITLVFLLLLIVLYAIMRYRKWLLGISMVLFAWILATAFFKDLSTIGSGAHNFNKVQEILKSEEGVSKEEGGSEGVRILIWKSAWELISKNPLIGVGTGDIKDELKKVYKEREYIYPYERNYNAHNQYLQTWAALGTIGLLSLLGIFGLCVLEGLFRGNYFFFLLTVNVAVACVTESILEVQAGVVFLTFFVALVAPVVTAIPRQKLSLFSKTA